MTPKEFSRGVFLDECDTGFVSVFGGANDADNVVEVVEGDCVAFEDVGTLFCFSELKLGAAVDDFAAVLDIALEHFFDVQLLGASL